MGVEDWGEGSEPEDDDAIDLATAIGRMASTGDAIPTGFEPLDKLLRGGGLRPGRILLIGGPPGAGKTTLATMAMNHMAPITPAVGLFADEGRDSAATRLGQQLGYKRDDLERGASELLPFIRARMEGTYLLPDPDSPVSSASRAINLLQHFGTNGAGPPQTRLLVLDSAQTIPWTATQEEDPEDRMAITRLAYGVRREIKKREWIGILTAQASYEAFKHRKESHNLNPLAAFAGSRALVYAADVAMVFGIPNEDDVAKVWVAKNRLGRKGMFAVKLDREKASLFQVDLSELDEADDKEKAEEQARAVKRIEGKILAALAKFPGSSGPQLIELCEGKRALVSKALSQMREDNKVKTAQTGPRKSLVYDLP